MNGESFYKPSQALDLMASMGRIDGGCPDCRAYQTVEQVEPGVYSLVVHHDSTCPELRRVVARRGEGS